MKNFFQHVAAFALSGVLFLSVLWIAGCNFDGTWDSLEWDHPTNWTDTALHPDAR